MKRLMIGHLGLFTLLAAFAVGCGDEEPTETEESEQTSDGVRMVGLDQYGEEVPGGAKVVEKKAQKQRVEASKSCPTCGPVPDPWKSIFGPVPDPWEPKSSSPGGSGSGTSGNGGGGNGNGNNKP
jgi:hypothetical protein